MKVTFLLILFVFILAHQGRGQEVPDMAGILDGYIVPLTWIDKNPRLRLGVEYGTHNKMGYSLEIGYGNRHLNHTRLDRGIWGNAYSFFEVRPEIKWYVRKTSIMPWHGKNPGMFPKYLAVEMFYQMMHDELENQDFNPKILDTDIAYDEARFKKIKIGLQAKAGIKFVVWKNVVLDFYQGVGLAYRNISYTNLINPRPLEELGTNEQWFPTPYKNEGAYFLFQVSLGVRLGYIIGRM